MQQAILQQLESLGVDAQKGIEQQGEEVYLQQLKDFITGFDFMRLGQSVNRKQWESAHMTLRRMSRTSQELGLTCMARGYAGMREAVSGRDVASAKQILAVLTQKRLQIRRIL